MQSPSNEVEDRKLTPFEQAMRQMIEESSPESPKDKLQTSVYDKKITLNENFHLKLKASKSSQMPPLGPKQSAKKSIQDMISKAIIPALT